MHKNSRPYPCCFLKSLQLHSSRFGATVPLQVDSEPMGIIRLYAADRREFTPREMEFVSVLAELCALALKNACL